MDTMIHSACGDRRPGLRSAQALQSLADSNRPPRVSAVPLADSPAEGKNFAHSADSPLPSSSATATADASATEFVEFFGRILIEKVFFQNLHVPQDLLLTLANNVIRAVSPTRKTRVDMVQEAIIAGKRMMGKALTAEQRRYEQASKAIDVPGEIMNGLKYSALALIGTNLLASVSLAMHQKLWSHVPAIIGYGSAVVIGPKVIQAAVDGALRCSGLDPAQRRQLSPWLNTVGRLAMGFMPKVNASEQGVHYRYPSTGGCTETVTSRGSAGVAGGSVNPAQQASARERASEPDRREGMPLTLHSIHQITQDNIKLYVLDQDGKKICVQFAQSGNDAEAAVWVCSSDQALEADWNREIRTTLPSTRPALSPCHAALAMGAVMSTMSRRLAPALVAALPCLPEISAAADIASGDTVPANKRAVQQSIFPASLDLDHLDGDNGFTVSGEVKYEGPGYSVSSAGDINGDQVGDLVLGAIYANVTMGAGYVIFGSRDRFPATFNVNRLNGANGFAIPGIVDGGNLGWSVSTAGDINTDGIDDLILGAPSTASGDSYVVFGSREPFPAAFDLRRLDGKNGFAIPGLASGGRLGGSVGTAGDLNGDGISDLVLGARNAQANLGSAYVIYGRSVPFPASMDLARLDGGNGFAIPGIAADGFLGVSVGGAGDINGDGIDDLVLGALGVNAGMGASYVIFGRLGPFPAVFNLSHLDGANGFTIPGQRGRMQLGISVSTAGDVNDDNIPDLVLGAARRYPDDGLSYLLFGSRKPFPASFALDQLDGTNGFKITHGRKELYSASSVRRAGDVNGDGVADLAIGPDPVYPGLGTGHVIFGSSRPFPAFFDLRQLDGANGFTIPRRLFYGSLGMSVNAAGDINGDQVDDLAVGVHLDHDGHGASYLLFGKKQRKAD